MSSRMSVDKHGNKTWEDERGYLHREDGPAIEYANGQKDWFVDGLRHRIEGPAIERPNGLNGWYIQGRWITDIVLACLQETGFPEDVHLGILADRMQELGDTRFAELIQGTKCEISF